MQILHLLNIYNNIDVRQLFVVRMTLKTSLMSRVFQAERFCSTMIFFSKIFIIAKFFFLLSLWLLLTTLALFPSSHFMTIVLLNTSQKLWLRCSTFEQNKCFLPNLYVCVITWSVCQSRVEKSLSFWIRVRVYYTAN